jgi:hypothetical protein
VTGTPGMLRCVECGAESPEDMWSFETTGGGQANAVWFCPACGRAQLSDVPDRDDPGGLRG